MAVYRFIFMAQFEAFYSALLDSNQYMHCMRKTFIDSCIPDTIQFAVRHQACFTLTPGAHMKRHATSCIANDSHVSKVNVKALGCGEHQISRSSVENDSHFLRWSSHLQHLNKVILSKFNVKQGRFAGLL